MSSLLRRAAGLAIAAVFLSSGVALAGNGSTVTHFTAQYSIDYGPPIGVASFDCTGDRIVKTAPNPLVKDSEVCTTAAAVIAAGVYPIVDIGWWSDYEWLAWAGPYTSPPCDLAYLPTDCIRLAVSGTLTVTHSKKTGLYTWDAAAYYAP